MAAFASALPIVFSACRNALCQVMDFKDKCAVSMFSDEVTFRATPLAAIGNFALGAIDRLNNSSVLLSLPTFGNKSSIDTPSGPARRLNSESSGDSPRARLSSLSTEMPEVPASLLLCAGVRPESASDKILMDVAL